MNLQPGMVSDAEVCVRPIDAEDRNERSPEVVRLWSEVGL